MKTEMKIYEIRWTSQDEKEWVAAHTIVEAIQIYCSITNMDFDIHFEAEDEVVEVPKSEWANLRVRYEDDEEPEQTFEEWMKSHTRPDIIAGTMYDC